MDEIVKLFTENNIKYVVSVDDCYQDEHSLVSESILLANMVEDIENFKDKLNELQIALDISLLKTLPKELREREISKFFIDLSEDEKRILSKDQEIEDTVLSSDKDNLLLFLNELKKQKVILEFETFANINDAKKFLENSVQERWAPSEDKKVLWLIDREFGEKRNEGFTLLEEFSSEEYKWNIGILATQNTSDISHEEQFNSFLEQFSSNNLGENKNSVWLVQKSMIDPKQSDLLAEAIMHGLRRNYTFMITNFLTNTLMRGIQEASHEFKNIDQSTINNIILNFSSKEGTSIIETLSRVLFAISKHDLNKKIAEKYDDISKLIMSYEDLCREYDFDERKNLKEVYQFRNKEKYNTLVNQHYYPVGFGDIFEINGKEYILVSQPCDIQIRGDKGDRNLEQATLLRMSREKPDHKAYLTLNYYHRTETYYVLFRETLLIDFNVLDLCSFNMEGNALIKIDQLGKPLELAFRYSMGQRKRLQKVLEVFNKNYNQKMEIKKTFEDIQKLINESDISQKDVLSSTMDDFQIRSEKYWDSVININTFNSNEDVLYFPVKRICRLDEVFTTNIMIEYSTNNSRLGLPGDYGAQFIHTEYNVLVRHPYSYFSGKTGENISIGKNITVLLDDDEQQILKNTFLNVIKGNVSLEIEKAIDKSPKSFISIDKKEKNISIPGDYLVEEGRDIVLLSKGLVVLTSEMFRLNAPAFYHLITLLKKQLDVIKRNRLFRFVNNEVINEKISFKLDQFVDGLLSVEIDGTEILTIEVNIEENNNGKYDINVNLIEYEENIAQVHEKLTVK